MPTPDSTVSVLAYTSSPLEDIPEYKRYAYSQVVEKWGEEQWEAFDLLIQKESSWDSNAQNPTSTAFGYAQFLNSTWGLVGCQKTSSERVQIDCAIKYIKLIYGYPQKAINFHRQNHWY